MSASSGDGVVCRVLAQLFPRSTSLAIDDIDEIRDNNDRMKRSPAELVSALCLALAGCAAAKSPATSPPTGGDAGAGAAADSEPEPESAPEPDDEHLVPPGGRPPRSDGSPVPPDGPPK